MTAKPAAITYDDEVMALYIQLSDVHVQESIELGSNIYLDLDADGSPVGIEILHVTPATLESIRDLPGVAPVTDPTKTRAA